MKLPFFWKAKFKFSSFLSLNLNTLECVCKVNRATNKNDIGWRIFKIFPERNWIKRRRQRQKWNDALCLNSRAIIPLWQFSISLHNSSVLEFLELCVVGSFKRFILFFFILLSSDYITLSIVDFKNLNYHLINSKFWWNPQSSVKLFIFGNN